MVECAVMEFEMQLTTIVPGRTPCLACLYPEKSDTWKRQFPVFGAVSCTAGGMAAVEAIKLLSGLDGELAGRLLVGDLRTMSFKTHRIRRVPNCAVCGQL
jgi:bacteriocin biosynthesis cyclodehydratase domain-containing protein